MRALSDGKVSSPDEICGYVLSDVNMCRLLSPTFPMPLCECHAQKLVVGMRLWGMVLEVTPKGLQVSLPHGLRGSVAPDEVSRVTRARSVGLAMMP